MTTEDIAGTGTLIGAMTMNILEAVLNAGINEGFVFFTSIGGLVYLFYKIRATKKEAALTEIQTKIALKKLEHLNEQDE